MRTFLLSRWRNSAACHLGKVTLLSAALLVMAGCSTQNGSNPLPPINFPNLLAPSAQLTAACKAEVAAGTPSSKAPDCVEDYIVQNTCNALQLAGKVPISIPGTPGAIVDGSIVATEALCAAQGFYGPVASPAPAGK